MQVILNLLEEYFKQSFHKEEGFESLLWFLVTKELEYRSVPTGTGGLPLHSRGLPGLAEVFFSCFFSMCLIHFSLLFYFFGLWVCYFFPLVACFFFFFHLQEVSDLGAVVGVNPRWASDSEDLISTEKQKLSAI